MRIRILVIGALLLNSAAMAVQPSAGADKAAIRHARLRQNAAIVSHDLDAIASYWTDDVTICRGLGIQMAGKAAYLKLFAEDDPVSPGVIIYERDPVSIDVSSVWPLAFETGVWKGHLGQLASHRPPSTKRAE